MGLFLMNVLSNLSIIHAFCKLDLDLYGFAHFFCGKYQFVRQVLVKVK